MEFLDFKYFKNLAIYSLVVGALCATVSLIPFFMPFFSLFFVPFLGVIIPMVILIVRDNFHSDENKTYAILGGISGFCLSLSYVFILVPSVFIFHLINKGYYDYGVQYLNPFLFILFYAMIALVYIITNATVGLIIGIIYKYFKGKQNG